jgi:phage I-like protein
MSLSAAKPADVGADLAAIREDLSHLSSTVAALLKQQGQAIGNDISATAASTGEAVSAAIAGIKPGLKHAGAALSADIERNPATATLIAFAAGMALTLLLRHRA